MLVRVALKPRLVLWSDLANEFKISRQKLWEFRNRNAVEIRKVQDDVLAQAKPDIDSAFIGSALGEVKILRSGVIQTDPETGKQKPVALKFYEEWIPANPQSIKLYYERLEIGRAHV
jgi:hypothetical protein